MVLYLNFWTCDLRLSVRNTQYTYESERKKILRMMAWSLKALCCFAGFKFPRKMFDQYCPFILMVVFSRTQKANVESTMQYFKWQKGKPENCS